MWRTLGLERHAAHFERVATSFPWLAGIARRAIGVRAPRYATLWGLSAAKVATLRRVAAALADGTLRECELEALPSSVAAERLCAIKGIGPWTAAVILLRGLGRLDVFPQNDSGVARSLRALTQEPVDVDCVLRALAPEQGMLYDHLLLARLEAAGATAATRRGYEI